MANPAPTINQINAFNATQGTTIDFNIIGGTELVRSNRIYIYNLSDNSLICTHLYVSTESIHELPPNTDGSILYADGKSSADFVNGAQYYAQIQTFTDIAGTEGGSGLSVAKMFWCLVDPTLTIDTIPSTISTTSYNVSATYDANTSVVSNIIQQYQFSLYSATGSLLQSSGVVVGNGEQQGTSTAYDISYNFSGLSVGSSYYVTVEVTTTQGMSVSAQSGTFTVSIDTPTLGEATVVNNACDGYISVTSNLSGEYGGSGSGEIVSFETDSENVFTKLQVNLDPIQDLHGYDSPWVGGSGDNLLNLDWVTGITSNGVTFTIQSNGKVKVTGTASIESWTFLNHNYVFPYNGIKGGDQILLYGDAQLFIRFYDSSDTLVGDIVTRGATSSVTGTIPATAVRMQVYIYSGYSVATAGQVFNEEVGFYISKNLTFTSWTPYSNICPIYGHDSVGADVVGKNLLALPFVHQSTVAVSKDNCFFIKAGDYTFSFASIGSATIWRFCLYMFDESGNALLSSEYAPNVSMQNTGAYWRWSSNASDKTISIHLATDCYIRLAFSLGDTTSTMQSVNAQLELGSTATDYEPYQGRTITTSLGRIVYGGTLDVVSGVLTVDKYLVVLNGTETAYGTGIAPNGNRYFTVSGMDSINSTNPENYYSNMFEMVRPIGNAIGVGVSYVTGAGKVLLFVLPQDITTSEEAHEYFANQNAQFVLPLATPQTYQLTPKQIQTLVGTNNVWSEQGDVELSYHIPITNLLVKRQDVDDVSGNWLTLYSQPITQASDMDFTFIDFLNQYGKTYKYALVPLLTQTQSGVEVEVEGGYTVSDEVQSIFDGVFISDSTGSQKCKANVGYGNVDMNQVVGSITPIGAKYPIIITNSQNQYHNGSISGTIVPDDYYFNGNLSRIDMVNKRNELEQFLTNKRAKIIKDWNGNIWLAMIMDNVSCTFNNNYGMGIVNFSTNWIEVGDPTNQQDLQATGLINVGGA